MEKRENIVLGLVWQVIRVLIGLYRSISPIRST